MVEKSKPPAAAAKQETLPKRTGILKKSSSSLEPVPEFAESSIQRADSNLDTVERERTSTPHEEQQKFKALCEGVQNCLALFQTSLSELLAIKDELLKHALPPSLLLKVALVTGKLFRSSSDLSVPITELVRMVKLFSTPWETKSAALKKLHEDYENKQRQLNVALQKLVLVGIQSERLAQERKVLNWEKLFSKMMTSKAQGYRWKFLIESFKEKVKTGEVYAAGISTDEEAEREKKKNERELEFLRRRGMNKDTAAKRIMRESLEGTSSDKMPPSVSGKDNDVISDDENLSDPELKTISPTSSSPERRANRSSVTRITITPDTSAADPKPASVQTKIESKKARPRIKFFGASDNEDSEEDEVKQSAVKFTETPSKSKPKAMFADARPSKHADVRFFQSDEEEDEDEDEDILEDQTKAPVPVPPVITEDKGCWTHEPEFDNYLHLRIYRPDCEKAETSFCSVAFSGQLLKTEIFEKEETSQEIPAELAAQPPTTKADSKKVSPITKTDKAKTGGKTSATVVSGKKSGKTSVSRGANSRASSPPASRPASAEKEKKLSEFKEVMFKLPNNDGCVVGEPAKDITLEPLRFAVHPGKDRPMIAMATITYGDLKILEQFQGRWSHTDSSAEPQQLTVTSVVPDRGMPLNTPCGQISLFCYLSQVERLKNLGKSTETIPFDELVDAEIASRKQEEEGEAIVKEKVSETPEALYTEGDVKALKEQHAEEIKLLQEEYEKRLNELTQGLGPYSPDMEYSHHVVDAATSPMLFRPPSLVRSPSPEQGKSPRPPSEARPQSQPRKPRPRIPNLPEWGKDLPEDFLVRLHLFNENSSKYHQELTDKTRRAIQERYELQMAVQNRLGHAEEEREEDTDICLPAVFMPTRTGHVFSPKAHSYFHPPGSSQGRLTQPPSMLKLPSVPSEAQASILNLFEQSKRYNQAGHPWYTHAHDQPRPHTIANPEQSQAAPPPPTACDMWSPPPSQSRARTT
ncbi:uncharacterized protein LOC111323577 [Stylophora pistillata]|uniref:Uncharacterized protein n=1 Tax=Stylophora pistillata TaxID=50429 RepID=A0A2B4SMU1_STYPI|nr:uncharacterized protein LOC111323577 [Stylophora pistillata]PFX30429.1 hypothetical protein AWC38_SpisGene4787 [Stylophora pistillata]